MLVILSFQLCVNNLYLYDHGIGVEKGLVVPDMVEIEAIRIRKKKKTD